MRKKLLLFVSLLIVTTSLLANKTVWNFSDPEFAALKNPNNNYMNNLVSYVTEDGLTIQGDGAYSWAIFIDGEGIHPEFDGITYTNCITSVSGAEIATGHTSLPWKNRYLTFDVTGDSEIEIIARSYANTGELIITDHEETFVETIAYLTKTEAGKYIYNYEGGPTRLYVYGADLGKNTGINIYAISATNVAPVVGEKTLWNFSDEEFASLAVGTTDFNEKNGYTTEDHFTVVADGNYGWFYRNPDPEVPSFTYKGTEYTNTFEVSKGVGLTATRRYFQFPVKGNSLIEIGARSYNGSPMGKLVITDAENTFVDTVIIHSRRYNPTVYSYMYQGDAAMLKLIPVNWSGGNDGMDFYFVSATNAGYPDPVSTDPKTVWNFSDQEFADLKNPNNNYMNNLVSYVTDDGLTIHGDGKYSWAIFIGGDGIQPEFDGVTYTNCITSVSGAGIVPGHTSLPWKNRYLSFDVTGDSEIEIIARSYANTGELMITDHEETFVETIATLTKTAPGKYIYNYEGGPTRLYLYGAVLGNNTGITLYSLSATNVVPVEGEKTLWNFSEESFASLAVGTTDFNGKKTYTTDDNFSVVANGSYGWFYRTPDNVVPSFTYKETEFTNTFEVSKGINMTSTHRYFQFPVKGNSLIEVGARSYNGTPMGKLIITDVEETFVDTLIYYSLKDNPTVYSYMYQGEAAELKLMPIHWSGGNDGMDFYFVSATNVDKLAVGVEQNTAKNQFVIFNDKKIFNTDNLTIEIFNISGQAVMKSNAAVIDMQHLHPGVYIVRDKKSGNTIKLLN